MNKKNRDYALPKKKKQSPLYYVFCNEIEPDIYITKAKAEERVGQFINDGFRQDEIYVIVGKALYVKKHGVTLGE